MIVHKPFFSKYVTLAAKWESDKRDFSENAQSISFNSAYKTSGKFGNALLWLRDSSKQAIKCINEFCKVKCQQSTESTELNHN